MLVSVVVVTYNSSRFVIETLDSVYRQSFQDIELIVSDDCSKDNTFTICENWIENHRDRFVKACIIKTPRNSGICANYNYALHHSSGEWIKYIAGDDILENNCIERFVENIKLDTFLYTCITKHLSNETGETSLYTTHLPDSTAWRQARYMLKYLRGINGPTLFIERKHLLEIGGFEEKYPMIEDWPIAIRFATKGWRIGIVDEPLVRWRIYGDSISHSNHSFSVSLQNAYYNYSVKYCIRYLFPFHGYHHWLNYWLSQHINSSIFYKYSGYILRFVDLVNLKRKIFPISKEPYKKYDS